MPSDTLVFDIETQNFFTHPGIGWNNFGALKISVVGVYSYEKDQYHCFEEDEMAEVAALVRSCRRLVGFCSNHYDVPVLNLYLKKLADSAELNLWHKDRVDLLDEIEATTGKRISLSRLAQANLGAGKDHHGSEAIAMWERGEIEKLKEYCLKDVRLTKELYDLYLNQRCLLVPDRDTGQLQKVEFPHARAVAPSLF